mmetsp:Transcript_17674/g.39586  ORF Transcript_17674/g.39586 Transcript_17674/m.39586 type:complete len:213 (+) Transcript_17674:456-1094(+)
MRCGCKRARSPLHGRTISVHACGRQVELFDDMTASVAVELPIGFVYLDDGKARFYNEPLMAYLSDKLMKGAVVALDDPWQEEGFPFGTRGHYGQAVFAHELVSTGAFSPIFTPRGPPKGIGQVHGKPSSELMGQFEQLATASELYRSFQPSNTIALRNTRSSDRAAKYSMLRLTLQDSAGAVHGMTWVSLNDTFGAPAANRRHSLSKSSTDT